MIQTTNFKIDKLNYLGFLVIIKNYSANEVNIDNEVATIIIHRINHILLIF